MTVIKTFERLSVSDSSQVFNTIADRMSSEISSDDILQALNEREALASTNLGSGIAFPHCKLKSVKQFSVGIFVCEKALVFGSAHKDPVDVFVVVVAPMGQPDAYIKLMGGISKALKDEAVISACRQSQDLNTVVELLGV